MAYIERIERRVFFMDIYKRMTKHILYVNKGSGYKSTTATK